MHQISAKTSDPCSRPVALVTGARRGLGRAIAYCLADAGYDLVINDLVNDEETATTVRDVERRGVQAVFIGHDVGDIAGHAAFVERAAKAFGRLDCLVNNAGVQVPRRINILEVGPEEFDLVVNVNLRGTFFLTQQVARVMAADQKNACGRSIISITSANSGIASTDKAAYCLAKSALSMMTSLFALELGQHNIGVFEVRPGLMMTEMTASVRDKYAAYVAENTVFRRWGQPEEVGRTVAALAVGAFPYASGQVVNVDGGMHIHKL